MSNDAGSPQDLSLDQMQMQRLLKEQTAINELMLSLGQSTDLKQIYLTIQKHLSELMDVSSLIISFYDPITQLIEAGYILTHGNEVDVEALPKIPLSEKGRGTQSEVIHTGIPVYIPDYPQAMKRAQTQYTFKDDGTLIKGPPPEDTKEEITKSALLVPMMDKGVVMGVMQVQSYELDAYDPQDQSLLCGIANAAAIAIQNARLIQSEKARRHLSETLVKSLSYLSSTLNYGEVLGLILDQLNEVIPYDSATVQLIEKGKVRNVCAKGFEDNEQVLGLTYPLQSKYPNYQVITKKEPLAFDDIREDYPFFRDEADRFQSGHIRSWLGIPLIVKGEAIGMITADRNRIQPFNEEDKRFAMAFASQAASSIENARLYEESRKRVAQLNALRDIDQAISGSFDLRVTLKILLNKVVELLHVDACMVMIYNEDLQYLEMASYAGSIEYLDFEPTLRMGEGHAGRAAIERKTIHLSNPDEIKKGFAKYPKILSNGFKEYLAVPLESKGKVLGVLELFNLSQLKLDSEWNEFLQTLTRQAAIAVDNLKQFEMLQKLNTNLVLSNEETLEGWAKTLDLRVPDSTGHGERVARYSVFMAKALGLSESEIINIQRGALLHDLGKLGIPDHILQKPSALNEEEWVVVKKHPVFAYDLLSSIKFLQPVLEIPLYHHERWNGGGYPKGLKGDEIPLAVRIVSVSNVFDALQQNRPYRSAWQHEEATRFIREQSGQAFEPMMVDLFCNSVLKEFPKK